MQLSPKTAMWLNIAFMILTAVSTGTLSFSGIVSTEVAVHIATYATFAVTIVNIVMHAYSNSSPGPLAPAEAPVVAAAKAVAQLPANASPAVVSQTKAVAEAAVAAH